MEKEGMLESMLKAAEQRMYAEKMSYYKLRGRVQKMIRSGAYDRKISHKRQVHERLREDINRKQRKNNT